MRLNKQLTLVTIVLKKKLKSKLILKLFEKQENIKT